MLFVLATAIAGLAAAAVAEGRVAPGVHLLPNADALGPSPFQMLNNILTVVSGECMGSVRGWIMGEMTWEMDVWIKRQVGPRWSWRS
jgi:hypothetical protein